MNPPEHQRKRDRNGHHAPNHDQPMRRPSPLPPRQDKPVQQNLHHHPPHQLHQISQDKLRPQKHPPPPPKIHRRRRPLQPHRVPVHNSKRRKQTRKRIGHQ